MATTQTETIAIKADEHDTKTGTLHMQGYTPGERAVRACKALAICWGLALLSFPVIGAHWVLVPTFVIAGPVMAYMKYQAALVPECVTGSCPICGDDISIALDPGDKLPKWSYCPACGKSVHLMYHSAA